SRGEYFMNYVELSLFFYVVNAPRQRFIVDIRQNLNIVLQHLYHTVDVVFPIDFISSVHLKCELALPGIKSGLALGARSIKRFRLPRYPESRYSSVAIQYGREQQMFRRITISLMFLMSYGVDANSAGCLPSTPTPSAPSIVARLTVAEMIVSMHKNATPTAKLIENVVDQFFKASAANPNN